MRKLLKSLAFIVLAISFLVSAAGCNIANRYVLDWNIREAVTSVGLDPEHEGLRIEQIYDDYEMGDGVKIYKLSFGEKAAALFEDWITRRFYSWRLGFGWELGSYGIYNR